MSSPATGPVAAALPAATLPGVSAATLPGLRAGAFRWGERAAIRGPVPGIRG